MPSQNRKTGNAAAAMFSILMVITVTLSMASLPLAAQSAGSTITVLYGNGTTLPVQDWRFVYEYLESDTPLDPTHVAGCAEPSNVGESCSTLVKTGKDLIVIGPLPGPSAAARVPFILPESTLQTIRIHWADTTEFEDRYVSEAITVVTTQGAEILLTGRLQALPTFLSSKRYVYLLSLSVVGSIQVQGGPGRFELRLDERFPPTSLKERADEIRFPSGTDRAGLR